MSQPMSASVAGVGVRPNAFDDLAKTSFFWAYTSSGAETVEQIGRVHGYLLDFAPIASPPLNRAFTDARTKPPAGEVLIIPWPAGLLSRLRQGLITGLSAAAECTRRLMEDAERDSRKVDDDLFKIDLLALGVQTTLSVALVAAEGFRQLGPNAVQKTAAQLLRLSALSASKKLLSKDSMVIEATLLLLDKAASVGQIASVLLPPPKPLKRDAGYYLRHALGPWNPSYWAQTYIASVRTHDPELWMYGSAVIEHRDKARIQRHYSRQASRVLKTLRLIDRQLTCSYYWGSALIAYPW
jgi:hypothetical protein